MPHLLYGSRYWRVSSDELALPAVCAVAGRTFWSIVLLCFLSFAYRVSSFVDPGSPATPPNRVPTRFRDAADRTWRRAPIAATS